MSWRGLCDSPTEAPGRPGTTTIAGTCACEWRRGSEARRTYRRRKSSGSGPGSVAGDQPIGWRSLYLDLEPRAEHCLAGYPVGLGGIRHRDGGAPAVILLISVDRWVVGPVPFCHFLTPVRITRHSPSSVNAAEPHLLVESGQLCRLADRIDAGYSPVLDYQADGGVESTGEVNAHRRPTIAFICLYRNMSTTTAGLIGQSEWEG